MKKVFPFVASILLLLCSCSGPSVKLDPISDLAFASSDGEVSWSKVENATEYEYTINEIDTFKTSETSLNIFDVVKDTSVSALKVRAINGNASSEYATLSFSTKKLATPKKGVVTSDPETHDYLITWEEVADANRYLVSVNGKKYVTYNTNVFRPQADGSYYVNVKCKAYVKNKSVLYLESDVSEKSEVLEYLQGPALSVEAVNVIAWSSTTEYDSYNLYIDGTKVRENVSSPMNLVTGSDPVITKTGEYDLQIEAIKNGQSYWSNISEQFGTSNINENEIYSFDNRKFLKNIPSGQDPGIVVSDEQSHSAPYSLFLPAQTQVNLLKYASSGINEVDYRKVNKISYWAYIPEIKDYSGTVKGYNLPSILYDGWGSDAIHGRLVARAVEHNNDMPIGEWTQLHFEVENQYENVVVFGKGATITLDSGESLSVPVYIDDICYDEVDSIDYDFKFKYDFNLCSGAYANQAQKLAFGSEFANKEVEISMDVCGNANPEGSLRVGLGVYSEDNKWTGDLYYTFSRENISSMEYSPVKFVAKLDAEGNLNTALAELIKKDAEGNLNDETMIIYAKNVKCELSKYSIGTLVPQHFNANDTYVSVLAIPTNEDAGTSVEVTMDIAVQTTSNYSELRTAKSLYATEIPTPDYKPAILSNSELKENDDWRTITFFSKVLNDKQINFQDGKNGYTHNFSGNYILVYLHGHYKTDLFYYKSDSIKINAISLAEKHKNKNNYVSILAIPTDKEVGVPVNVNMDVNIYSESDYAELRTATSMWSDGTPKFSVALDNANVKANKGWRHISFASRVIDASTVKFHDEYTQEFTGNYVLVYLFGHLERDYFYYKEDSISLSQDVEDGTYVHSNKNGNTYYVSVLALPTDEAPETPVHVSLDVNIKTASDYSELRAAYGMWSDGKPQKFAVLSNKELKDSSGWQTIEFDTRVMNASEVNFHDGYTESFTGNYVLVYLYAHLEADYLYYKPESVNITSFMEGGTYVPSHKNSTTYTSVLALPTDEDAGTPVEVSMDVGIHTDGDFSELRTGYAMWNNGTPKKTAILSNTDLKEISDWRTVTFTTRVMNAESIKFHDEYTQEFTGNYILVYLFGHLENDYFFYKENSVSINALGDMVHGGDNGKENIYYQTLTGLTSDLPVGTHVNVEMDVKVIGTFDAYSDVYWVDSVYSDSAAHDRTLLNETFVTGETDWHHVSFDATIRNFASLKFNGDYGAFDTSSYGNAVYLVAQTTTEDSFLYKNVSISLDYYAMASGGNNGQSNVYYQSMTGLSTNLEEGTIVVVEMDVKVIGTFDVYSDVYWVDSVWTADGGERKTATSIKSLIVNGEEDWHHVSFIATVRNFEALRQNSQYPVVDMSNYGNAVYLLSCNKSIDSFGFKNVSIEEMTATEMMSGGAHADNNGYYQSMTGLSTELEIGIQVQVEMEVYITGSFADSSGIYWVDSVWTADGGESDKARTNITSEFGVNESGWHTVTFTATVRNFPNLRFNTKFTTMDMSSFGNAVYLITQNKSANAFFYRNVTLSLVD